MTIYKYPLFISDYQQILMPAGALILSCQIQREVITLWAVVDPNAEKVKRYFEVVGTGHDLQITKRSYIATVQMDSLVWHVFELLQNENVCLPNIS